jgi:hypothetical protein
MKNSVLAVLAFFFYLTADAQNVASGYVFLDANENGKKDRRENGIANVAVSNGRDVVLTDKSGKYELPVQNDNIIFVIKPSGYQSPLNSYYQYQNYYTHKPQGSPKLKYEGVASTGTLPKSIDFPLMVTDESKEFTALVFGDPQAYSLDEIGYFNKGVIQELRDLEGVSFGISLGDLVGDHLDLHTPYLEAIREARLPWYHVMGNHDMNYDVDADSLSDETFEKNFGPVNYAFNYGNAHFIVLDDILYPDPRDGNGYWGGFRKDQLDFVENNLKFVPKDKLIVLAFHIPLMHHNENAFRNADRQRLFDLLKEYPNTLSMSAHTHLQRHNFYGKADGWHGNKLHHEYNAGTTSGDWYSGEYNAQGVPASTMRDGTPKGYALLRITDNQYVIDHKVAGKSKDYQIQLSHPKVVGNKRNVGGGLVANFFMGRKGDKVQYRINDGKWTNMSYFEAPDPSYVTLWNRWNITEELIPGRRPSNPVNSTHLWQGTIPAKKLEVGEHTIEVRATDMFGRTFTEKSIFRVE